MGASLAVGYWNVNSQFDTASFYGNCVATFWG
jgi:hypothetical protein